MQELWDLIQTTKKKTTESYSSWNDFILQIIF